MVTMANFVHSLKELLPEGIADSGTITVWTLVVIVLSTSITWVLKSFEDDITKAIRWLFATRSRALFIFTWFVFLAIAAGYQSGAMLLAAVITPPALAVAQVRFRWPRWTILLVSLAAMLGAYWYEEWRDQAERDAKRIYFILSFANENRVPSDTDDIRESWSDCKQVLSDVFSRVTSVKIEVNPPSQEYKDYLWEELMIGRKFDDLLLHRGRPPDVVLIATISMFPGGASKVFKSRPELATLQQRQLVRKGIQWEYATNLIPLEDKPFLSLAIAAWVWRWVESESKGQVTPKDSTAVNRRILERYDKFLDSRQAPDGALLNDVRKAEATNANVAHLLGRYGEKLKQLVDPVPIQQREGEKRQIALNTSQLGM